MNPWLIAAALAAFSTFLIHTFVGGRVIARPLLAARDLPRVPRLTVYFCWHMVTVLLFGMAAALAWAARHSNPPLVVLLGLLALAFAGLSLGLAVVFRVKPWHLPQWALFLVIAALAGLGLA
ncbi:hypothetical protein [Tahibacter caeni]|uniref:hypothetical protein n=1 Tax=Tahibacter caeni TaxID=1453545 RepID=UPI00214852C5|nr:hypothetical protein [Tahibacter caeni]